jgi:hypothetical protein
MLKITCNSKPPLEGLEAFTPDRTAYLAAAFYGAAGALAPDRTAYLAAAFGAAGALAAAVVANFFIGAWRRHANSVRSRVG